MTHVHALNNDHALLDLLLDRTNSGGGRPLLGISLGLVGQETRAGGGTVSPRTAGTTMRKPASSKGRGALSFVLRPTHDSRSARTARLRRARQHIAPPTDRGTRCVEVEKLNINAGPVDQIVSSSMLAKRLIVG